MCVTLVEDIGARLGCGAYVSQLRRTAVKPYEQFPMYTLEKLQALKEQGFNVLHECLLPVESALHTFPAVKLSSSSSFYMKNGAAGDDAASNRSRIS